jgi:hypothetical protein
MILGMSVPAFTLLHVVINSRDFRWTHRLFGVFKARGLNAGPLFLSPHVRLTGFLFHPPVSGLVLGILSLVVGGRHPRVYVYRLAGSWRWIYVAGAVVALYFNVFVGVVQAFQKLSFLQPLAPTQSEPPFFIAQAVVLATFIVLGIVAVRSFHPEKAPRSGRFKLTKTLVADGAEGNAVLHKWNEFRDPIVYELRPSRPSRSRSGSLCPIEPPPRSAA